MAIDAAPPPVSTRAPELPVPPPAARPSRVPLLLLLAMLLIGAAFRFNGLDWDEGKFLHPDELHVTDVISNRIEAPRLDNLGALLNPDISPLNPRSVDPARLPEENPRPRQFAYGSLPLFVTDFAAWIWGKLTDENWNLFYKIFRVGRVLTVICDLITILLAFGLARRAYGTTAGLIAAGAYSLATMPVQLAHFFVTDTWTATFVTATLWATLVAVRRGDTRSFAIAGLLAGCSVATKATVAIVGLPILVAAILVARRGQFPLAERAGRFAQAIGIVGLAGLFTFFLFEPYAIINPQVYLRDIGEQSGIISGRLDVPYTRQYVGTIPLVFQAKNLLGWELGPLLGVTALLGLAWTFRRAWKRRDEVDLVLLAWIVPYLGLLAVNEAKFMRYLLPAIPVLCAFGAKLLVDLGKLPDRWTVDGGRWTDSWRTQSNGATTSGAQPTSQSLLLTGYAATSPTPRPAAHHPPSTADHLRRWGTIGLVWLVLGGTALTTLAFSAIYSRTHTQVAASRWFYENVPKGAKISAENWDHSLPLPLDGGFDLGSYDYEQVSFDLYNDTPYCNAGLGRTGDRYCSPNNEATRDYIIEQLTKTDYVIQATNRLSGSIPRLPWRYPVQQQYYELLFAERLGFVKVYDNASYPTLGPFEFDDSWMDESFTVYDHPHAIIYKKERQLSQEELRALFEPVMDRPLSPHRAPKEDYGKPLLLTQLVDQLPAVRDYAWNKAIGYNGLGATLLWLLTVEMIGVLALPLTLRIFRHFPDRGWGVSKLIGWLVLAYPIWLLASLRLGQFTLPFLLIALLAGAAAALTATYRWRNWYRHTLRGARVGILASEGVFLLAGAFFLFLRLKNPDLWHTYQGGEKPMELAHLNGILRSVNFPPLDPWYADGYINYYYYGQYLVATLVKLTGIPIEVAFNLAMPTISALVAAATFSVAGCLAGLVLGTVARNGAPALRRMWPHTPLVFGALGAVFFVGMGNLDTAARLIGRVRDGDTRPIGFDYFWGGSRTIEGAITETPYFTQVWADLHAHAIALPFAILALGTIIALVTLGMTAGSTRQTFRQFLPALALLALTLGALFCTNAWDVPTYLLVTGAGLFHALRVRSERRRWGGEQVELSAPRRIALTIILPLFLAGVGTAATGAAAYLLYLPFFRNFKAIVGGIGRTRIPTPLIYYLDHFGFFMALIVLVIVTGALAQLHRRGRRSLLAGVALLAIAAALLGSRATFLTELVARRSRFFVNRLYLDPAWTFGQTAALLSALLVCLLALWVFNWGRTRVQLPLALLIAGVGVTLGPEVIFVADDLMGGDWERMNTVFKFYMQGWTLFTIGGIGALAWVWQSAPRWSGVPFRRLKERDARRGNAAGLRIFLGAVPAILLIASFAYPLVATQPRLAEQFPRPAGMGPTLNGYRWMEYGTIPTEQCREMGFADDYMAIKWLNETVVGTPVIAEAAIGPYRGNGSRFSIATGLPTILGWDRHEYQQRPPEGIARRVDDVRLLYNSPDVARKLAILREYHVSYIVVGSVERNWYYSPPAGSPGCSTKDAYASAEGLAALEGLTGRYLEPAFRSGETVIYRVLPAAYSSGVAAGPR